MSGEPDLKQGKRIIDHDAIRRAKLRYPECASCEHGGMNGHHVLPKDARPAGDDVIENIISLCGSGTTGCHGAEHGNPYTDEHGKRWTTEDVRRAIGRHLLAERPDVIFYVLSRCGIAAGQYFLWEHYYIEPDEAVPTTALLDLERRAGG